MVIECASKNFEPGWLVRQCHEAHISCMADHSPWFFAHSIPVLNFERPVSDSDAREIFEHMDKRFKEWTSKTIAEHLAAR